jgi:hypothetical protein
VDGVSKRGWGGGGGKGAQTQTETERKHTWTYRSFLRGIFPAGTHEAVQGLGHVVLQRQPHAAAVHVQQVLLLDCKSNKARNE